MLPTSTLVLRYSVFATIATIVNVITQVISTLLYTGRYELYVAMLAGTCTGLIIKYILDYHWIFQGQSVTLSHHSLKFTCYSMTGVFTTGLFWGTELIFAAVGDAYWLRYVGAVLGLSIGYFVKYQLDRHFVFREISA